MRRTLPPLLPLLLWLLPAATAAAAAVQEEPRLPELSFEAGEGMGAAARRLEAMDRQRLTGAVRLSGLSDPGPPIRVLLVPEDAPLARQTPSWVAGFASGPWNPVVLFPARPARYPYDSLEDLLQHEVAHVLIDRAAAGRPVPRWLHEGIAMTAGDRWGLEDSGRFAFEVARRGRVPLTSLDRYFHGPTSDVARAYAIAGGFVNFLLRRHGPEVTGEILAGLAAGRSVDAAFQRATGESLGDAEEAFWRRETFWFRWVPLLTSSTVLWIGVTALALMAIVRRRQRDAELRRRWEEEEEEKERQAAEAARVLLFREPEAQRPDEDRWVN
jgi:hypothetical protein